MYAHTSWWDRWTTVVALTLNIPDRLSRAASERHTATPYAGGA